MNTLHHWVTTLSICLIATMLLTAGCLAQSEPTPTPTPTPTPFPTFTPAPTIDPTIAAQETIIFESSGRVLKYAERIETLALDVCLSHTYQIVSHYQGQANQAMNSWAYKLTSDPEYYADPEVQVQMYQELEAQLRPIVAKLEALCLK